APPTPRRKPPPRWKGIVRRMNPAHMLFGPVFQRDVRAGGRKLGLYLTRGGYTLALLAVSAVALIGAWGELDHQQGAAKLQGLQSIVPGITLTLLWFQFILIALAAPAATAPCICDERNKRTLPALLTTPLTPSHLIFANLSSRAVNILILTGVLAPVLLAMRVFGGVEAGIVLAALAITLSTALLGASLGLLASIDARRPAVASTMAHILLAAIFFGPIVVLAIIFSGNVAPPPWAMGLVFLASGPLALGALSVELMDPGGAGLPISVQRIWTTNVAINITLALIVCAAAILRLRARLTAVAKGRTPKAWARMANKKRRKRRKKTKGSAATEPRSTQDDEQEQLADHIREVSNRPILWRELRQPLFRSLVFRLLLYVGLPLFLIWFGLIADIREEPRYFVPTVIAVFVFVFIGATASAQTITAEREGRTWEEILTTRLSAFEILVPKILAALRRQWPLAAFAILYLGLLGVGRGDLSPVASLAFLAIMGAALTFLATVGAAASLVCKKSSTAGMLSIAVPLAIWAGLPLMVGLLSAWFNDAADSIGNVLFASHPLMMCISGVAGSMIDEHDYMEFQLAGDDVGLAGYAILVAANVLFYLLLSSGVLFACIKCFNPLAGRSS
ncbi:MAG: ABC transporter permease subunit, partial [Planctomycetota bacterium]